MHDIFTLKSEVPEGCIISVKVKTSCQFYMVISVLTTPLSTTPFFTDSVTCCKEAQHYYDMLHEITILLVVL